MANETGATSIQYVIATDIVSREVGESLIANVGIAQHVWNEQAVGSKTIKFGLLPALTAAGFTDTTGMSLTEFDPTRTAVTVAPVGLTVRVTGFASALRPQTLSDVAQEQGKALAVKIDTDLAALFPSVTAVVNRTTTTFRMTDYLAAVGILNAAKVPQGNRIAVLSAKQYQELLNDSQTVNQFAFSEAAKTGSLPNVFGVGIMMSQALATANSAADYVGCMFERKAFGLGTLTGVNVEIARAPVQFASTDIGSTIYYGVALIDTNRAVKLVSEV